MPGQNSHICVAGSCPRATRALLTAWSARMAFDRSVRSLHQARARPPGAVALHQIVGDIVRRRELRGEKRGSVAHGEDVPEAHPGIQGQTVVVETLAKRLDQFGRFGRRDVARRVAHHATVLHGHQVAPHRHLARVELDAHGRSLYGPPAGVVHRGIEAHDAHARHRTGRLHAFRHVVGDARGALLGQSIEIGRARGLQGRAPVQGGRGPPRRPVDYEHNVFHPGFSVVRGRFAPLYAVSFACRRPEMEVTHLPAVSPDLDARERALVEEVLRTAPLAYVAMVEAATSTDAAPSSASPAGAARPYVVPMNFAYEPRRARRRARGSPAPAQRTGPQGRRTRPQPPRMRVGDRP